LGVDYGQGYLWSPPASLETITAAEDDDAAVA
jgi:EAL domain-containing protein (putative c-di-GMP-specific phosphodiesterase class I)